MIYALAFAVLIVLFGVLLIVQSQSKSTIFNDTSTAFIAKLILGILFICMLYSLI